MVCTSDNSQQTRTVGLDSGIKDLNKRNKGPVGKFYDSVVFIAYCIQMIALCLDDEVTFTRQY